MIILQNIFTFLNIVYSCGDKAEFSAAIIPVFSVTQYADFVLKNIS